MASTSNRTEHLSLRITKDERSLLKEKAEKHNLTLTDFILQSTLKDEIELSQETFACAKELKKIGVNINQLVHKMHKQGLNENQILEIQKEWENIWLFLKQLQAKLPLK